MKITRRQLRQIINEVVSEGARGNLYRNVSLFDAERVAGRLAGMGRNRDMTYGDQKDLQQFVRDNFTSWDTSREAEKEVGEWLVSKGFGYEQDYRR